MQIHQQVLPFKWQMNTASPPAGAWCTCNAASAQSNSHEIRVKTASNSPDLNCRKTSSLSSGWLQPVMLVIYFEIGQHFSDLSKTLLCMIESGCKTVFTVLHCCWKCNVLCITVALSKSGMNLKLLPCFKYYSHCYETPSICLMQPRSCFFRQFLHNVFPSVLTLLIQALEWSQNFR